MTKRERKKVRINISIDAMILEKVDELASSFGISRNSWIVQNLGQQAFAQSKVYSGINDIIAQSLDNIEEL